MYIYVGELKFLCRRDLNAPFFYIYDSANAELAAKLEAGFDAGCVAKGATVAELAASMGVDAAAMEATFGSVGGVFTTDEGRVLREDGSVLNGLYAAGEMSNRYYYNENYILAASLGLYATMGNRAGASAAADAMA